MNDIELIDEIVRRAEEHQKQKQKEFAIAELEKIKAEIKSKYEFNFDFSWSTVCSILDDLDNHIKELKGDNK